MPSLTATLRTPQLLPQKMLFLGVSLWLAAESRAGTLTGTFSPIATGSNVVLTTVGKLDWGQWGLYTDTSFNRKASVTPKISNFTLVGTPGNYQTAYQYANNANGYTWYDGAPVASVTNTTTGVWAYQYDFLGNSVPLGSGFRLTVPADTTQKTLLVYVGAYAAEGQFTASLSDGSASSFTSSSTDTVNNFGLGPGGVFAINFAADSSNQTLTVKWTLIQVNGNPLNAPNVTLQAAALTSSNANNPPFVTITNPANSTAFLEPATIAIQADAQDFDSTVTNVAFYAGTNRLGETTTSPYSFTWNNPPRGRYSLTARAMDSAGAIGISQPVEVFVYGTGGSQTESITSPPPATVDLTSEGTADWAHWGLTTNTSYDYKNLVPRQISNFIELGTNAVQQYTNNYTAYSWSDGTPTSSANGTTTGVFVTGQTNGFLLTAPADSYPRRLRVYVGGYGVQGEFQAWLSDLSAAPFVDVASVSNVYHSTNVVYTINYTAASAGQQLIVNYRSLNLFDQTYGNVTLQAATLQSSAPKPVQILNPQRMGSSYTFSFQTQTNYAYTAQYTYSLNPASWQTVISFPGNGAVMSVTNQNATASACFYRVLTQ